MKKIFISFITISALILSSCSGDDGIGSSSNGIVKMEVDGQQKVYSVTSHRTDLGDGTIWITFGATSGIENLMMSINERDSALESVSYTVGGILYTEFPEGFTSNATVSTNGHLRGTFSGKLVGSAANQTELNVTEGTFDIIY